MDMHSRDELTKVATGRYWKATKKEKGAILAEFCMNTGYEHKYAIKKLRKTFLYPDKRETKKDEGKSIRIYDHKTNNKNTVGI